MIRCSACNEGEMVPGHVESYDVSPIVGVEGVFVASAPALVCDRCAHVMFEGVVVDNISAKLARALIELVDELRPTEVRFLRELLSMTQGELADRLRITRATVNRWEMGEDAVGSLQSFALRTLAAWSLGDVELARAIGSPRRKPGSDQAARPYRLDTIAS